MTGVYPPLTPAPRQTITRLTTILGVLSEHPDLASDGEVQAALAEIAGQHFPQRPPPPLSRADALSVLLANARGLLEHEEDARAKRQREELDVRSASARTS